VSSFSMIEIKVTKERDPVSGIQALLFQIDYPEISEGVVPRHRFMSSFEQKIQPPDKRWQYLLFAAEPYETISFKIPSREIDKSDDRFWTVWNRETRQVWTLLIYILYLGPWIKCCFFYSSSCSSHSETSTMTQVIDNSNKWEWDSHFRQCLALLRLNFCQLLTDK
jgi:hypothetical protein